MHLTGPSPLHPLPPRGPAQAEAAWPQADPQQMPHSHHSLSRSPPSSPHTPPCHTDVRLTVPPTLETWMCLSGLPLAPSPASSLPSSQCLAHPSAAPTLGSSLLLFSRTRLHPCVFEEFPLSCLWSLCSNASFLEGPSWTSLLKKKKKKRPGQSRSPSPKGRSTADISRSVCRPSSQSESELHVGGLLVLSKCSINCC